MRKRAEFRNEVKTRLKPDVYARLQRFKDAYAVDSDSAALARIVEMALFGIVAAEKVGPQDKQE